MPAAAFLGLPALFTAISGWISAGASVLVGAVGFLLAKKGAAITAYAAITIAAFVAWDTLMTTIASNVTIPQQVLVGASWFLPNSFGAWLTVWLSHQAIMLTLRIKSQALEVLN